MRRCKQCGKCCYVGTIWVHSKHPIIRALAEPIYEKCPEVFSDTGKCMMLTYDNRCLIELIFGKEFKPDPCNEYPSNGEKCHEERPK